MKNIEPKSGHVLTQRILDHHDLNIPSSIHVGRVTAAGPLVTEVHQEDVILYRWRDAVSIEMDENRLVHLVAADRIIGKVS